MKSSSVGLLFSAAFHLAILIPTWNVDESASILKSSYRNLKVSIVVNDSPVPKKNEQLNKIAKPTEPEENSESETIVSSKAPGIVNAPSPKYPLMARHNGWQGTVEVSFDVLKDGKVSKPLVTKSSGYGILDREALSTIQNWTFIPATRNGNPIIGRLSKVIEFKLLEP